jgi:hypothetical protein
VGRANQNQLRRRLRSGQTTSGPDSMPYQYLYAIEQTPGV